MYVSKNPNNPQTQEHSKRFYLFKNCKIQILSYIDKLILIEFEDIEFVGKTINNHDICECQTQAI